MARRWRRYSSSSNRTALRAPPLCSSAGGSVRCWGWECEEGPEETELFDGDAGVDEDDEGGALFDNAFSPSCFSKLS